MSSHRRRRSTVRMTHKKNSRCREDRLREGDQVSLERSIGCVAVEGMVAAGTYAEGGGWRRWRHPGRGMGECRADILADPPEPLLQLRTFHMRRETTSCAISVIFTESSAEIGCAKAVHFCCSSQARSTEGDCTTRETRGRHRRAVTPVPVEQSRAPSEKTRTSWQLTHKPQACWRVLVLSLTMR